MKCDFECPDLFNHRVLQISTSVPTLTPYHAPMRPTFVSIPREASLVTNYQHPKLVRPGLNSTLFGKYVEVILHPLYRGNSSKMDTWLLKHKNWKNYLISVIIESIINFFGTISGGNFEYIVFGICEFIFASHFYSL